MATESKASTESIIAAREFFHPTKHGFSPYGEGWVKELSGIGTTVVTPLDWRHNQVQIPMGGEKTMNALEFVGWMQEQIWGMPHPDVGSYVGSIISEAGGQILAAYIADAGLTPEGWLGFYAGLGSNSALWSHMLGIRKEHQGNAGLGSNIKLLQAYYALAQGHSSIDWSFDPMRGPNASLNTKVGATMDSFHWDKYGIVKSELYGPEPSDRLIAHWDLTNTQTQKRMSEVMSGEYKRPILSDFSIAPQVNANSVRETLANNPDTILYEIPGDIDELMKTEKGKRIAHDWRVDMRKVFTELLDTKRVESVPDSADPALVTGIMTNGKYRIIDFISDKQDDGRHNYYVFQKKQ